MRRRSKAALLLFVLGAAALAGCGVTDPYSATQSTATPTGTSTATVTNADPAPERGGTIPRRRPRRPEPHRRLRKSGHARRGA
jgi:hypothetical protein